MLRITYFKLASKHHKLVKCKLKPGWSWGFVASLGRLRYPRIILSIYRWFIAQPVALLLGWAVGKSHSLQVWPHPVRYFLHWVLVFLTEANSQHLLKNPPIKGGICLSHGVDWIFSLSLQVCSSVNFYHFQLFCHSSIDACDSSSVKGEAALPVSKSTCWRLFVIVCPCRFTAKEEMWQRAGSGGEPCPSLLSVQLPRGRRWLLGAR